MKAMILGGGVRAPRVRPITNIVPKPDDSFAGEAPDGIDSLSTSGTPGSIRLS